MADENKNNVVQLERHRLNKRYARALETMGRFMLPWKSRLKEGSLYITVDENGMVYGRIIEFIGGDAPKGSPVPSLIAKSRHYTQAEPEGKEEEIFVAQVWGLLTEKQFERARQLGWPAARGRFLDQVVTDDPRYTIIFHPSDIE